MQYSPEKERESNMRHILRYLSLTITTICFCTACAIGPQTLPRCVKAVRRTPAGSRRVSSHRRDGRRKGPGPGPLILPCGPLSLTTPARGTSPNACKAVAGPGPPRPSITTKITPHASRFRLVPIGTGLSLAASRDTPLQSVVGPSDRSQTSRLSSLPTRSPCSRKRNPRSGACSWNGQLASDA